MRVQINLTWENVLEAVKRAHPIIQDLELTKIQINVPETWGDSSVCIAEANLEGDYNILFLWGTPRKDSDVCDL